MVGLMRVFIFVVQITTKLKYYWLKRATRLQIEEKNSLSKATNICWRIYISSLRFVILRRIKGKSELLELHC